MGGLLRKGRPVDFNKTVKKTGRGRGRPKKRLDTNVFATALAEKLRL